MGDDLDRGDLVDAVEVVAHELDGDFRAPLFVAPAFEVLDHGRVGGFEGGEVAALAEVVGGRADFRQEVGEEPFYGPAVPGAGAVLREGVPDVSDC